MKVQVLLAAALICAPAALGLDRSGPIVEARVYFDNTHTLARLGDLAGELDVCTWDEDETGGWLVINTDKAQLEQIRDAGLYAEVTWPDVRDKFRAVTGIDPYDTDAGRNFGYFFTYYEMEDTLDRFVANYPNLCTKVSAGVSFQGRQLWCLKISDNPGVAENEPACFFNGATHAREPMGTHACIYFADHILRNYGTDPVATALINNREIYIVPVMNPDGYVYNSDSGGASSNWRKNRRGPVPPSIGIDLNRNYGYKWGYDNQGSSGNPSSETYRGPSAFSEPATAAIRDFCNLHRFRTQMDFHTYGRYNMYPWGYGNVTPPDQPVLREAVDTFRMYNNYPASRTGQLYSTIYPANGITVDWEYSDSAGKFVTYAYTIEMDSVDFWHGWNDSVAVRIECLRNRPVLYYLARIAGVWFDPVSVTLVDQSGNGRLEPGETAGAWFTVKNRATHPIDSAYAVTATLRSGHAQVTVTDSVKPFPSFARRSQGSNQSSQFAIAANPAIPPGTVVPLELVMAYSDEGRAYTQPVSFQITIGTPSAVAEPRGVPAPTALTALPNPASKRVFFGTNGLLSGRVDIFSGSGARVASVDLGRSASWDCSAVPAGIYYCRLAGSNLPPARVAVTR
ncbi:MAG: M14 family zinc carboxypeptidase [bacterium]